MNELNASKEMVGRRNGEISCATQRPTCFGPKFSSDLVPITLRQSEDYIKEDPNVK